MASITALRATRSSGKRVNLFLDGELAFRLDMEAVAKLGLRVGLEVSADQIETLARSEHTGRCRKAALRFLSYRPRSEFELRDRLRRRGFDSDTIDSVADRLRDEGLLDDVAFARFWKDNRETFSPRSRWLTGQELRKKGVAVEIIDKVVGEVDDLDGAHRAASDRAQRLSGMDYQTFQRRLGDYLKRRGFSYGVIIETVRRLWGEQGDDADRCRPASDRKANNTGVTPYE